MRIPKVLRGLGYENVQELALNKWHVLRDGFEVMCGSAGSMDSWLAVRTGGITVLNLNDCMIEPGHLAHIGSLVGKVTVLLTQFSFANWIGNHKDELGEVDNKLHELKERVLFFKPETTIPFASFIYFCNQENSWMNEFAITPQRIAELGLPGVCFMYPGDEWDSEVRTVHSREAVERYMADIAAPKTIDPTPEPISPPVLQQTVNRTLRTVRLRFGSLLICRLKPFSIYLHDLEKILIVDPDRGCTVEDASELNRRTARYTMCSQVAWYAFAYSWGWGAMEVSGMYLDRHWHEPNPLAFYLNVLSTEFLDFGSIRGIKRTAAFLWAKRHELLGRVLSKMSRRGGRSYQDGGEPGAAIASSRTA
jgi:UDP-MurNAc hydroxylase